MLNRSVIRELTLFTFCPPGPLLRDALNSSSGRRIADVNFRVFILLISGVQFARMNLSARNKTLAIYAAKCVTGILLCFPIYMFLREWVDYTWSLISVILVLSPEGKDAVDLALTRIKANFIGAGTGILILLLQIPSPWNLAAGAMISLFICDRFKLNAGARSTLAALIIILLHQEGSNGEAHLWDSALSRIIAVVSGCLLGLLITYVFHSIFKLNTPVSASEAPKKEREG